MAEKGVPVARIARAAFAFGKPVGERLSSMVQGHTKKDDIGRLEIWRDLIQMSRKVVETILVDSTRSSIMWTNHRITGHSDKYKSRSCIMIYSK
jgi:hypothetical protein